MHQFSPRNSTIVDGTSSPASPESKIKGIRSPSCSNTSCALAQVLDPERFALVPVSGTPNSSIKLQTTSFFGTGLLAGAVDGCGGGVEPIAAEGYGGQAAGGAGLAEE